MTATKRESLRVYFGDKDPIDRVLSDTIRILTEATAMDRTDAGKRLMTLGAFAYHGYDWRIVTDRMPKQKIVWVDIVWAILRNESCAIAANATTATSVGDTATEHIKPEPKRAIADPSTTAEFQSSAARVSESGSHSIPRISSGLKFPP